MTDKREEAMKTLWESKRSHKGNVSRTNTKQYQDNWERIFNKTKEKKL